MRLFVVLPEGEGVGKRSDGATGEARQSSKSGLGTITRAAEEGRVADVPWRGSGVAAHSLENLGHHHHHHGQFFIASHPH